MSAAVVCIGLATRDSVFTVPKHPPEDGRVVAAGHVVSGGGPAATAAVTLARLGVPTAFVGTIGDDAAGSEIWDGLEREGVDVSALAVARGGCSPESTILVRGPARTIVHYPGTAGAPVLSSRARELVAAAAWVHVDHHGYEAAPRGGRLSIDGGNPIGRLDLHGVELYAPTEARLLEAFGGARGALRAGARLVVATRGEAGSVAYLPDGAVVEAPSPPAEIVSTLGAGDVFHGALVAALLGQAPLERALAFANRCAALSCRALDGRSAIPTLEEAGSP